MTSKKYLKVINRVKKDLNNLYKKKFSREFRTKKDFQIDPVTKLDIESEKIIRRIINSYFPEHNIVGEELKRKKTNSNYTWVIDPIDGTKSMIMGLPTWSNLIGLYKNNDCILSWANFPILKKYYLAYDDKVIIAEHNHIKRINTNKNASIKNHKLTINTLHSLRHLKVLRYIMNFKGFFKVTGIDAHNFCSIAEGRFDVLIESGLKLVDILPMILIVNNSGAIISDWNGGQNFTSGKVLVASNKQIHNFYLKKLLKN